MRTKVSIYNTLGAILWQGTNLIANFILPIILISQYGSAINGLIGNIRSLVVHLAILEGGLAGAAVFALYKPIADKDHKTVNGILTAANRFFNRSGILLSIVLAFLILMYPRIIDDPNVDAITISSLVLIIGMSGILDFFVVGKYKALLRADQKSYVISIIQAIAIFINAIIIIALARLGYNIILVQAIAFLSFVLRSILYYVYCKKRYDFLNLHAEPMPEALNKKWDVLFLQILGTITNLVPIQIVTLMLGLEEASVYTVYNNIFLGVLAIISVFSDGLAHSFGDMLARKEGTNFKKAYSQYEYLFYIILGIAFSLAAILIIPFVSIYAKDFTDVNYIRPLLGVLFALNGILFNAKAPQGMLVISAGLYKETRVQTTIQGLLNLVFSILFASMFGMPGVLLGGIVANTYRVIDLAIFIPKHVTKLPVSITVRRIIRMLLLSILCVAPSFMIDFTVHSYMEWLIVAIISGIWCVLIFAIANAILEKNTIKAIYLRFKYILEAHRS